ncbi:hypothetical protein JYU14_03665 [Simkania negevensis]|uniref:Uncharacterized protein n=1 Tax=Simkania negevensis TaxID=83561 RepID=A0ABS3AU63_9BACT|nr:hypothetical protein [Simkania negevensis]
MEVLRLSTDVLPTTYKNLPTVADTTAAAAAASSGPDTDAAANPIPLATPDQPVTALATPVRLLTSLNGNWRQNCLLVLSGNDKKEKLDLKQVFAVFEEAFLLSPRAHYFIGGGSAVCSNIDIMVLFNPNFDKGGGAGLGLARDLLKKQLGCTKEIVWAGILECYEQLLTLERYSTLSEYQFASDLAMRCSLLVSIEKSGVKSKTTYSSKMIANDLCHMGDLFEVDSTDASKNLSFTVFTVFAETPVKITFCKTPVGTVATDSYDALALHFAPDQLPNLVAFPVCEGVDARDYDAMLRAREFRLATNSPYNLLLRQDRDVFFKLLVRCVNNLKEDWVPVDPTTTAMSLFLVLVLHYFQHDSAAKKKPSLGEYLIASTKGLVSSSADRFYDNLLLLFAWLQNVDTLDYESRQNLFRALPDQNDVLGSWIQCLGGDRTQPYGVQGVLLKERFIDILLEESLKLRKKELFKELMRMIPPKKGLLDWVDQHLLRSFQKAKEGIKLQQTQLDSAAFRSFCEKFSQDRLTHRFAGQLFEEFVVEDKEESIARFCSRFESLYPPSSETKENPACTHFIALCEKHIQSIQPKRLSENLGNRIFIVIEEFMRRYPVFNTHTSCVSFLVRLPHASLPLERVSCLMIELLPALFPQESTELLSFPKGLVEMWRKLFNSLGRGDRFIPLVDSLFATTKQTTAKQTTVKSSGNSKQSSSSPQEKHLLQRSWNQIRALETIFEKRIPIDERKAMGLLLPDKFRLLKQLSLPSNFFGRIAALLLGKQHLSSSEFSFLVDLYKDKKEVIKEADLAAFLLEALKGSQRDPLFEELLDLFIAPIIQQVRSHPLGKQMASTLIAAITSRRKLMEALSKETSLKSSDNLPASWRFLLIIEELSQSSFSEGEPQIPTSIDFSLLLACKTVAFALFYEQTKRTSIVPVEIKKQLSSNPPFDIDLLPGERLLLSHAAVLEGNNPLPWLRYQTTFSFNSEPAFVAALNEMFAKVYGIVETSTDTLELLAALEWLDRVAIPNLASLKSSDLIARCIYNLLCQKTTLSQQGQKASLDRANSMVRSFQKVRNWRKGIAALLTGLSEKPKEMSAGKISGLITTLERFEELNSDVGILMEILNLIGSLFKAEEKEPQEIEERNNSLSRLQVYAFILSQTCVKNKTDQGKTLGDYYPLFRERHLPKLITPLINLAVNPAPDSTKKMPKLEEQFVSLLAELFSSYYLCVPKKDFAVCNDLSFWKDLHLFIRYLSEHSSVDDANWLRALRATLTCTLCAVDKAVGEKGEKRLPPLFTDLFTREFVEKICRLVQFQGKALREKTAEVRQAFHSRVNQEKLNSSLADLDVFFRDQSDSIYLLLKIYLDVLRVTNVARPQEDPIVQTICAEFQRMSDVDAALILFKVSLLEKDTGKSNNGQIKTGDILSGWPLRTMLSRFSQIVGNEESMRFSWGYIEAVEDRLGSKKSSLYQYQTISPVIATILTNSLQGPTPNTTPLLSWLTGRFESNKARSGFEFAFLDHTMMCINITLCFEFPPSNLYADSAPSRKAGRIFLCQYLEDFGKRLFNYYCIEDLTKKLNLQGVLDSLFSQTGWMESSILLSAFIRGLFKSCLDAPELELDQMVWAAYCGGIALSAAQVQIKQLTETHGRSIWDRVVAQQESLLKEVLLLAQESPSKHRVSFVSTLLKAHQAVLAAGIACRSPAVSRLLCQIESDLIDKILITEESYAKKSSFLQNMTEREVETFRTLQQKSNNLRFSIPN